MEMFNEKQTSQNSLRDIFSVLFRHKSKVLIFFLLILLPVILFTLLTPEVYETEAKLFVRLGREAITRNDTSGEQITITQDIENQINSEIELLNSREMARIVVEDLGAKTILEGIDKEGASKENDTLLVTISEHVKSVLSFPKQAIAKFLSDPGEPSEIERKKKEQAIIAVRNNLVAEPGNDSSVINLVYRAEDPELAREILSRLIESYMDKHIELKGSPGSFDFFKKESLLLRRQLETTEANLNTMKNEIGIGELEEQRSILSERIGMLHSSMEETESEIASSETRIATLKERFKDLPEQVVVSETTGFASSSAEQMNNRINELKLQEQELLSTFTETSIPVREVRRQIREAEALLGKARESREVTMGANETYSEMNISLMLENGNLDALKSKKGVLDQQIRKAQEELRRLNEAEVELVRLQRQKDLLEENYRRYAGSMEQTRIDQARELENISNIKIAQAPALPVEPVSPNMRLNLIFGLFLAVFGGLGLAFFMEYMDDKLNKPEQVESVLELPVLGSIRKLEK